MGNFAKIVLWSLIVVILGGCGKNLTIERETDETAYRRGKSYLREGRKDEAMEAFLSVIAKRPDAAESHLEAGLLYLNHIGDPLAAIYHFRQYLAMKPGAEYADFVKELITTAKKDFAKSLPGQPMAGDVARADLLETIKELQAENSTLKQTLATVEDQLRRRTVELENLQRKAQASGNVVASQPTQVAPIVIESRSGNNRQAAADGTRRYIVQSGDTLSRISEKMYNTSSRWKEIFEANRDTMASPNSLRPGQELKIP